MTHSYSQMYLNDAMCNLAEAFDTAARIYRFELDYFLDLFIVSGVAKQFGAGNPKYLSGKSGTELVAEVVFETNAAEIEFLEADYYKPSKEYWTGWALAYYQWYSGYDFRHIKRLISMDELKSKYNPYHEMDEQHIADYIDSKKSQDTASKRLQAYRKSLGLSQSQLAKEAGINLRTLQQYEIGAKNISKASVSSVMALARVFNCDVGDLV